MKPFSGKWWPLAKISIVVALFVWLRWYSPLWHNRWTGLALGVAFALTGESLDCRDSARRHLEIAQKYDLPNLLTFASAIVFTIMGLSALKSWFVGPPFFFSSGPRAVGDNGIFAVLMCATAPSYLYASWLLLTKKSSSTPQDPVVTQNHG